ncbi:MAG: DUF222 domain-containing protein [Nocardioides sp.]
MEMDAEIEELSRADLLDRVADLASLQQRCEVQILEAAVQHAYLHDAETLDPADADRPGRERARRLGGQGTPEVTEFAAAELAGRLGCSTISAGLLMADGLDIRHRLPRLWRRVRRGEVRVYLARLVARKTRDLSVEQADHVDERVAEYADGRLTYTRFQRLVEGAVTAADIEGARQREQDAAAAQFAKRTRPDPTSGGGESEHGIRGFYIRAPFGTIAVFDAAVQRIADILGDLGDADPVDQRRVKALLVLARPDVAADLISRHAAAEKRPEVPWSELLPQVVVHVHTYVGALDTPHLTDPDRVARVEGCGAMSAAWVREHLTAAAKVTVRPVLDIEGQAPVDSYEIPERHRRAVHLMTPADTFPFATSLTPREIDHTEPFRDDGIGQSRIGNYGPLTTRHHRIKTHGRWRVEQPFAGIYVWRDPYGQLYLVDHTGTRTLTRREVVTAA